MAQKRRKHGPALKAKVAHAAIKGEQTINEISNRFKAIEYAQYKPKIKSGEAYNGTMDLIVTVVISGVFETLAMNSLNLLFSRTGMLSKIDMEMLGRMSVGWVHGRFRYGHPSEMEQVANEMLYGYITHYTIGVSHALPYVLGWDLLIGGPASPIWAFVYGTATTVVSYFFVYPSMGLGVFGRRPPEGIRAPMSSLANHPFYGMGFAAGITLVWVLEKA